MDIQNSANSTPGAPKKITAKNGSVKKSLDQVASLPAEFYSQVVASLTDFALITTDVQGKITSWNSGAEKILGYSQSEVITQPITIIYTPEDNKSKVVDTEVALACGHGGSIQERFHVRKDGTKFWSIGRLFPLFSPTNEIVGYTKILRDLTDQIQSEAKLKQHAQHFQTLMEKSSDVMTLSNEQGDYTYVSDSVEKMLGYTPEEFLQLHGPDLIHPEDGARVATLFKELLENPGISLTTEMRGKHKDGHWAWVEATSTNLLHQPDMRAIVTNIRDLTKIKHAEDAIKEGEERFRALADTAPMYLAMANEKGEAIYFNKQWLNFTGKTLDEMTGMQWLSVLHPDDAPKFEKDFKAAFKERRAINEQYRFRRYDGEYRWMLAAGAPRFTPSGTFTGYFGTYTDFHDLKEAQLAIQSSEERFRQLAETIPHIVFSSQADGTPDYYNRRWYDYTGSPDAVAMSDWAQFVHPDDTDRLISGFKNIKEEGGEFAAEYRLKRCDGEYRWHLTRSLPIRNHNGEVTHRFGTSTDIHDKKVLEENLEYLSEASKMLSSSLDFKQTFANIAILAVPQIADWCSIDLLNDQGGVDQVALSHKDPSKVAWAKELRKADPPDLSAKQGLGQVIRSGESEIYPLITDEFLQKSAKSAKHLKLMRSIGFTSAMIVPLRQGATCIGAITFISAEAKRRYNEADLHMAEELANRASMALENAGLFKASQDAITLRDDFISVASHELKTPVTSVKIFTQVLQKHSEQIGDERSLTYLQKMDRQLDKLTELIYNMLDISKIQVGRMDFSQSTVNFDALVEEIVESMQHEVTHHTIKIEGHTGVSIQGDADRLGQVLSNLIANAIKYSPHAKEIIVHLKKDKTAIICGVQDFGIGIGAEHIERIFERFYRVFDSTDKTFPGLGIGLYICSEIIQRHNGKLWVESNKEEGSTFFISLPIYKRKK